MVDYIERGGDLALLWEKGKDIKIMSYSQFHIDVCIKGDNNEAEWRLTGFYGNPETSRREES